MKYLNIDNRNKYGHKYVVRHKYKGKNFIVWTGNNKHVGELIALEVAKKVEQGGSDFLEWYDYDREQFIKELENG